MFEGLLAPDKLIVIALIGIILFGPKRLPSLGRKVGSWLGEFRKATGGLSEELKAGLNEPPKAPAAEPARATAAEPAKVDAPAEGPRPPV